MINYFELFGLPVRYHFDAAQLKKIFYERSRALHPDFYAQSIPAKQQEALRQSSLNNDGYKTLNNPAQRLQHLFTLYGLMDAAGQTQRQLAPDFLIEMLDLNEAAQEARTDAAARQNLTADIENRLASLEHQLAAVMQQFDQTPEEGRPMALQPALDLHLQRKYLLRIQESLSNFAAPS
jgi:molecular chaperone HscB